MAEEEKTTTCPYCRGVMSEELMVYKVVRDGQELLVEDVPTWVCQQCEATLVDDEIVEAVEKMVVDVEAIEAEEE
jgi:YgiT-type zinc finger domain-containing protein